MLIVDGHLDLAYNALRGRQVLLPAAQQQPDPDDIPTVGLPDLRSGQVGLIVATIYCEPAGEGKGGYTTAEEAAVAGWRQLDWYRRQADEGVFRFVLKAGDVPEGSAGDAPLPAVLLMEGADPIRDAREVDWWIERGLRAVGLAWKRTRYAGGTRAPGPLTADGVKLAEALDAGGVIHDTSHLAEESFWQLLDITEGPVMASHSNSRAIVPTDRQLSDAMAKAIGKREGMIGINFYDKFLLPPEQYGKRRAALADVAVHVQHFCDLMGDAKHVGLGTDMDGGLGRDQIPAEITSSADLARVAEALSKAGFGDADVRQIMGENWTDFMRRSLPA
jgi:membrane dipeptidase